MTELNEEEIKIVTIKIDTLTEKEKIFMPFGKLALRIPMRIGDDDNEAFRLKESNKSFSYRELFYLRENNMI